MSPASVSPSQAPAPASAVGKAAASAGFDPYAASSDDRYEAMARLRASSPVTPTAAGNYVATAAGVLEGLKHVEHFVGSFVDTSGLPEDEVMISAIPEPRHGRIRRVINTVVAAHRTARAEPFIRGLAPQAGVQAGVACQGMQAVADEVPRRLVAGDDEEHRLRADGVVGQVLAVDVGVEEAGDHVVGRVSRGAPLVDLVLDVGRELGVQRRQRLTRPGGLPLEQLVGPVPEPLVVVDRRPEHVRDDRRREWVDDVLDEVDDSVPRRDDQ